MAGAGARALIESPIKPSDLMTGRALPPCQNLSPKDEPKNLLASQPTFALI